MLLSEEDISISPSGSLLPVSLVIAPGAAHLRSVQIDLDTFLWAVEMLGCAA
jgi:hypothetical protein